MKRKVVTTADGSTTIHLEDWNEQYHSKHGAIQEAYHVFIKYGLDFLGKQEKVRILEIGFGTGLNALITYKVASNKKQTVSYTGVEAYPVPSEEVAQLNYIDQLQSPELDSVFQRMHEMPWEMPLAVSESFELHKRQQDFKEIDDVAAFDLVYFDAFGARVQPELWTEAIFDRMFTSLVSGGVLVTYAAKGSVRRAMQASGFEVERLPGPPGKREMLRAVKPKK
ncbi:tRNA (5-methylaminomethyl-2-thiouridine)(34)-methyltransferase MnmD [Sediminicola luteus]|uniref:SAM-dependent methyltransferase n=1 Tax=Sediminicola luteus TaxID=319238 RepID=A0A2A4G8J6_9FLAO|nr:tRNA (5-methylaminomethyl-2-thiouridine)(34)-methyltransferase MnmD [Sediminicola luteus]PCE64308.1 SAM-dependent methyltransferase [Sediminicola luteus]